MEKRGKETSVQAEPLGCPTKHKVLPRKPCESLGSLSARVLGDETEEEGIWP